MDFSNYTTAAALSAAFSQYLSLDLLSNGSLLISQAQNYSLLYNISYIRSGYPTDALEVIHTLALSCVCVHFVEFSFFWNMFFLCFYVFSRNICNLSICHILILCVSQQFVSWDGIVNYTTTNVLRPSTAPTSVPTSSTRPYAAPTPLPSALPTQLPSSSPTLTPSLSPSVIPSSTSSPSLTHEPTALQTPSPTSKRVGLCLIGEEDEGGSVMTSCGMTLVNVNTSHNRDLIGFQGRDSLYRLDVISPRTVRAVVCPTETNETSNASTLNPYIWMYDGCPFNASTLNGSIPLLTTSDETSQTEVWYFIREKDSLDISVFLCLLFLLSYSIFLSFLLLSYTLSLFLLSFSHFLTLTYSLSYFLLLSIYYNNTQVALMNSSMTTSFSLTSSCAVVSYDITSEWLQSKGGNTSIWIIVDGDKGVETHKLYLYIYISHTQTSLFL